MCGVISLPLGIEPALLPLPYTCGQRIQYFKCFLATLLFLLRDYALLYWDMPEANILMAKNGMLSSDKACLVLIEHNFRFSISLLPGNRRFRTLVEYKDSQAHVVEDGICLRQA